MAASFSELLLRRIVLRHIHCQTLCSNFEEWVTKSPVPSFWGSFLGKPISQRFPIWINGLCSTDVRQSFGHLTNCGSIFFMLMIHLKARNCQNLCSFGPCASTISIDSSRPFEVDSWKKLWILDLLHWFLRWTAFGQANLECRCWNKRKDSTCWNIFRWAYCFKTCNFFLSVTSWAWHER